MTENECFFIKGRECTKDKENCMHIWNAECSIKEKELEE